MFLTLFLAICYFLITKFFKITTSTPMYFDHNGDVQFGKKPRGPWL